MKYIQHVLLYLLLAVLTVIFIAPLLYALYNSLLPLQYVDKWVSFDKFTFGNYITLFTRYNVSRWLINTIWMTVIIVIGNLVLDTMAGYALARFRFPGRSAIFIIVIATMMVPYQLIITPLYITIVNLGWNNHMASVTVPYLYQCVYIFFLRQFFLTIPKELEDAARIDGLTRAKTFLHIIVPISKSAFVPVIILEFTGTWNSFFVPSTFINDEKLFPLVVGLNTVKARFFDRPNLSLAGVILLTIPVLIIYMFFQKWFVQGIASTGIKG